MDGSISPPSRSSMGSIPAPMDCVEPSGDTWPINLPQRDLLQYFVETIFTAVPIAHHILHKPTLLENLQLPPSSPKFPYVTHCISSAYLTRPRLAMSFFYIRSRLSGPSSQMSFRISLSKHMRPTDPLHCSMPFASPPTKLDIGSYRRRWRI